MRRQAGDGDPLLNLPTQDEVLDQGVRFKSTWWTKYIDDRWWPPSLDELAIDASHPGYQSITRRNVFGLAGDSTPQGRVRLLLAAYVWGTGSSAFLVGRRVRTFTRTPVSELEERLTRVDCVLRAQGPIAAYGSLLSGGENYIPYLGPSFFTKYLYFAAGHPPEIDPQPLILDRRVAQSINAAFAGWNLAQSGWPSTTYGKYLDLAAMHCDGAGTDRFEYSMFSRETQG